MSNNIITVIKSVVPETVCKSYSMVDGEIKKASRASIARGVAKSYSVDTAEQMVEHLTKVTSRTDMCLCPSEFVNTPENGQFYLVTSEELKNKLGISKDLPEREANEQASGVHEIGGKHYAARLKGSTKPSSWILLDADNPEGMPAEWAAMPLAQRIALWEPILPGISKCERIELRSSSARVLDLMGDENRKSHAWIRISDPSKLEIMQAHIRTQMILKGVWFRAMKDGVAQKTPGSIFDLSVLNTGRIVFCAAPELNEGMDQYVVDDAGIEIVNAGRGALNINNIHMPTDAEQGEAATLTGVAQYSREFGGSVQTISTGELFMDTPITSRGKTKSFSEWVEGYREGGMQPGDRIRCEAPFRESQSEAAYIIISRGYPCVIDSGNNTKYVLPEYVISDDVGDAGILEMFEALSDDTVSYADAVLQAIRSSLRTPMSVGALTKAISYKPSVVNAIVTSSAWETSKSKFFVVKPDLKISSEKDYPAFISDLFEPMYNHGALSSMAEEEAEDLSTEGKRTAFIKNVKGAAMTKIMDLIKIRRQFSVLDLHVDPFIQTGSITPRSGSATLCLPHMPLDGGHINDAIVADFRQHFPEFDNFIRLLVSARFASDRKQAHMWMQAPSNWGKSFLLGCLASHGLVVETSVSELDKFFSGGPVGKTISDFLRAWVLAVDEFKGVTREVKQLSDTLPFAPKGLPTVRTPLYLKMFLSAEDVPSLASGNGVEDQFANRFTHVKTQGRLDSRSLFLKSKFDYKESIVNYLAREINRQVTDYVAMGKGAAADAANAVVSAFYEEYRIDKGFKRLSDSLVSVVDDFVHWVSAAFRKHDDFGEAVDYGLKASRSERDVIPYVIQDRKDKSLYLTNYDQAIMLWLDECFDDSTRQTFKHKRAQIKAELLSRKQDKKWGMDEKGAVHRNYINGVQNRYIPLILFSDMPVQDKD